MENEYLDSLKKKKEKEKRKKKTGFDSCTTPI